MPGSDSEDAGSEQFPEYAKVRSLTTLVGDHPRAKILAVFVGKHYTDLTSSDVAQLAGLHRTTVYAHLGTLEDLGVIRATRKAGGATMWQINKESKIAKTLGELDYETLISESNARNNRNQGAESDHAGGEDGHS